MIWKAKAHRSERRALLDILVIGIGQGLRGDDRAGLDAVQYWQEKYPETASQAGLRVALAESPGLALLDLLHGAQAAILVDAVQSEAAPGTVHLLTPTNLNSFAGGSASAHGLGVAETLAIGNQLTPGELPGELVLIGIEADSFEIGQGLSAAVQAAIPGAAQLIEAQVQRLLDRTWEGS